ncbi:MAG: hypothetical protein K6F33_01235 [Bacteroidales bacterium]|nr:hypothetical protein [Bacteroidales bacterium]
MKKIITLSCLAIVLMLSLVSCRDMLMNKVAERINATCPSQQFDGVTLNSVVYDDNTFVFDCDLEESFIKQQLANMGLNEKLMGISDNLIKVALDSFADNLTAKGSVKQIAGIIAQVAVKDKNYKELIDLCISEKVNAKINIHIGDRQKSLLITAEDFEAARGK